MREHTQFEREKRSVAEEVIYGPPVRARVRHEKGEYGLRTKLEVAEAKIAAIYLTMREADIPEGVTIDQFGMWLMDRVDEIRAIRERE